MGLLRRSLGFCLLLISACLASRPSELYSLSDHGEQAGAKSRTTTGYTEEAEADRVTYLPGWGPLDDGDFSLFSGYVTVDEEAGRALFYVLVEKEDSAKSPLVLWLNGGPGCSSVGGGFLSELGPFFPAPRGHHLEPNPHSWHKSASILFLESPAFVGFSYSNRSADRVVGDKATAEDSHEFLLRWFERFPQFRDNPFWLSGESYAGHYVPNLAAEILEGNAEAGAHGKPAQQINFQGFLVGNAWTDAATDNRGAVAFWESHALISFDVRRGLDAYCNYSLVGPLRRNSEYVSAAVEEERPEREGGPSGEAARRLLSSQEGGEVEGKKSKEELCDEYINKGFGQISGINIYDIYADICIPPSVVGPARQLGLMLRDHPAGLSTRALTKEEYDPCVDDKVTLYLNRPDVQRALHANTTGLPYPWTDCSPIIRYSRADLLSSMIPVYKKLLKSNIRILVYSGDIDAIVPVIGTRRWIKSLGLSITKEWRAWRSSTEQVGGWAEDYEGGFSFASVRGAGHMVPYTEPERAQHLFNAFIHGKEL